MQDLLAHVRPKMTLNYEKLLDDTKRKQFENAVKQVVFSFDNEGKFYNENLPNDVLDMLWDNHKLHLFIKLKG